MKCMWNTINKIKQSPRDMFIRNNFCHFNNFRFQFCAKAQAIRVEAFVSKGTNCDIENFKSKIKNFKNQSIKFKLKKLKCYFS